MSDPPGRTPDVAISRGEELLAAADLADRVDACSREAHRRLIRAVMVSVAGAMGVGLLLVFSPGEVTWSATLFLVVLLLIALAPAWGSWWLFAATELADAREAAAGNRILVGGGASTGDDTHDPPPAG